MPLYINDPEVDKLAEGLVGLTKTTKSEAVKRALKHEISQQKRRLPMRERLAKSLAMAQEAGPFAPGDHAQETDELWDDVD